MKKFFGFTLAILLVLGTTPAFAQWWSGVGVHAGGNGALLRGDDIGITDNSTERNYGFTVGLYRSIPIGNGFAVQPEVMYAQKGGALSVNEIIDAENTLNMDVAFNVDYVEVPVMLSYTIPAGPRYLPAVYAGPYVSFATRRNVDFDMEGVSFNLDADDFFKRVDYGAAFGTELGFRMARRTTTIGVRYDLGVADILKNVSFDEEDPIAVGSKARTDQWSILLGVRL